ncbi:phosphate:acyl-[acyl carrier protein] acyltransferase [Rhizobiales bacterium GAS191]|jgi:glycerol-3-phosphate acyltransferase PlsX|nr:phosphate:acyl-[acyl carrier protein] acyltransferase [Rhizobiales bacterium GAS113]SEC42449.1 phosphate:acyl-[acyl carrier protein] acyltransferase [Rhizobiales bacterium GAS191]SEC83576.1 phosphate:acyl-[acyl carrier protein] acyltransferase [Rhizobiales bacterium GAS188]
MLQTVRIALDLMGSDTPYEELLSGASIARRQRPDIRYLLFGREPEIKPLLERFPEVSESSTFHHTDVAVKMDDKPSQALRAGRWKSSMWRAIEAVKKHEADVAVSAGNTGALMAMAAFCLRLMTGVDRPALAVSWPNARSESIVLDVGASIGADAKRLFDLAVMGAAMARVVFDVDKPLVGILNMGTEEMKGLEPIREAGRMLRDANRTDLVYAGLIEGDDVGLGAVDVIVTEGFVGNVVLKTAEGTAKQALSYLRGAMSRTLMRRIGYLFARQALEELRGKADPRKFNGGVFLGLNGAVVKSHGHTDGFGFASAINIAYDVARYELVEMIRSSLNPPEPSA